MKHFKKKQHIRETIKTMHQCLILHLQCVRYVSKTSFKVERTLNYLSEMKGKNMEKYIIIPDFSE